nr:3-oxoacyl-[acyl-carrier-protein] synthase III C-terminal domain-containing protein [Staphylospora marina]
MPTVISVGTAVPPHPVRQEEAKEFARGVFGSSHAEIDRLLTVFDHAAIETRYFSRPREWFEEPHSFAERNRIYAEVAGELAESAIRSCLEGTGVKPSDIDQLIFVSSTGIATPGIDAHLFNRLNMKPTLKRTPVWGLGCAGGAAGLARAWEGARAFPESLVLLVAVECCGLTFRPEDTSRSNLVATSLFADGASAVLVAGDRSKFAGRIEGPVIVDAMSVTWPDSLSVMGWEVEEDGLKVVFSKEIPQLVRQRLRPEVDRFLARRGLQVRDVDTFVAHPGGRKVLESYRDALDIPAAKLQTSADILRQYGNMSSATVLFVLERELEKSHRYGSWGLLTSLGPGFSLEMVLLRFGEPEHEGWSSRFGSGEPEFHRTKQGESVE